jgi:hypothetical protein
MRSPRRPPPPPPPLCRRERAEGGYRDACPIALPDYWTRVRYPAEGNPDRQIGARDRPALPADPAPPVEHGARRRRAQTWKPRRGVRSWRHAMHAPGATTRERRQFCQSHSNGNSWVEAKWRRGVGRHARQSGGGILRNDKNLSFPRGYKSGVALLYPSLDGVFCEDYRTAALFDSPELRASLIGDP